MTEDNKTDDVCLMISPSFKLLARWNQQLCYVCGTVVTHGEEVYAVIQREIETNAPRVRCTWSTIAIIHRKGTIRNKKQSSNETMPIIRERVASRLLLEISPLSLRRFDYEIVCFLFCP